MLRCKTRKKHLNFEEMELSFPSTLRITAILRKWNDLIIERPVYTSHSCVDASVDIWYIIYEASACSYYFMRKIIQRHVASVQQALRGYYSHLVQLVLYTGSLFKHLLSPQRQTIHAELKTTRYSRIGHSHNLDSFHSNRVLNLCNLFINRWKSKK